MKFRLRKADLTLDAVLDDLADLHKLTFIGDACLPDFDYGHWWMAYEVSAPDDPVAFCGVVQSSYGPEYGYLKRGAVLAAYRGHGLQRRLIRVRERQARLEGWHTLITDTTDNPHSANNLIACGYRIFTPEGGGWSYPRSIYWARRILD